MSWWRIWFEGMRDASKKTPGARGFPAHAMASVMFALAGFAFIAAAAGVLWLIGRLVGFL